MPRSPRSQHPGEIFHVASRGVSHQAIYRDDVDRKRFLVVLGEVVVEERWRCLTYCLMGNHYHLLVQLREPTLSVGMRRLNGEYARMFNERHGRDGHLFQGRFWSKPVRRDAHLLGIARYIALNPVRAELCRNPGAWAWSAHRALVGEEPAGFVDVETMLSHFAPDAADAQRKYATFLTTEDCLKVVGVDARLTEIVASPDRDRAIATAYFELGYEIAEIATALGCHPRTVRRRLTATSRVAP